MIMAIFGSNATIFNDAAITGRQNRRRPAAVMVLDRGRSML